MNLLLKKAPLLVIVCFLANVCKGQLNITSQSNAQALAQKLVGDGVSISNATLISDTRATGFFNNISGTNIGIDSGIVLTNGRAKTVLSGLDPTGLNGDGATAAIDDFASVELFPLSTFSGDADLASLINLSTADSTHDATILEFDFVPLGDSIKFRYVFSSEEYPDFACPGLGGTLFNDAFAFFIQGPGFPFPTNIALIPGSTEPVTIHNINDQGCAPFPQFYVNNESNVFFTHNGHTKVMTALARVQPCLTYHLKLVIADVADGIYDSGVFLEAKSLTSNSFQLTNLTQLDPVSGNSYLVEGCAVGALKIRRQSATLFSQTINLGYTGTAVNGVDVQLLPSTITIPANQTEVLLNIFPTIDNLPEGIETLKIYTLAPCGVATPTDSATIQIRDYDTLGISPDTAVICPGASIQLIASAGYTSYLWDINPGLSNFLIRDPIATPVADSTMFICTSQEGTCHGRDSSFIYWKRLKLLSKTDVNCSGASTGQITVATGPEWIAPIEYAIDNSPYQAGTSFNNLPAGSYTIKVRDGTGCIDSIIVNIIQAFPDLLITNNVVTNGSCTGTADGSITVTATGGKAPLQYSSNGTTFQSGNFFNLSPGTYTITVKDANGCTNTVPGILVRFDNSITLSTGAAPTICEGKNTTLSATTNGTSVLWTPAATLNSVTLLNPLASPTITTKYYIRSILGICDKTDSVTVFVNPAPDANAGADSTICFGGSTQLSGSGGVDYIWSPVTYLSATNVSNPLVTKPATITYYLSVTDANGCTSLSKDDVKVTVSPPAKLYAGADTAVAINQPLGLFATDINHIGFIKYHWSPERGLNDPDIYNPVATLSDYENYLVVTASTLYGCIGIDSIKVKTFKGPEIYVASVFTPNGDGKNDILKAFPVGMRSFSYFRIYNRYGQLVFSTTNENIGWDGKIKGYTQNMSAFVWMAAAIDFKGNLIQRKGTTMIIQ
ncbi:MAG: choice-of-anchor L domain-containing protein [Ferruginibacter sp.]